MPSILVSYRALSRLANSFCSISVISFFEGNKKADRVFLSICLAYHYSVVWEFKTLHKGKTTDLHLQNRSLKFCRINGENPDFIGVFTGYIYFVALTMVGVTGLEPMASWSRTKRSTKLSYTPMISQMDSQMTMTSCPHPRRLL